MTMNTITFIVVIFPTAQFLFNDQSLEVSILRFSISLVAGLAGLVLLGCAIFGQPKLYLREVRQQWNALVESPPADFCTVCACSVGSGTRQHYTAGGTASTTSDATQRSACCGAVCCRPSPSTTRVIAAATGRCATRQPACLQSDAAAICLSTSAADGLAS